MTERALKNECLAAWDHLLVSGHYSDPTKKPVFCLFHANDVFRFLPGRPYIEGEVNPLGYCRFYNTLLETAEENHLIIWKIICYISKRKQNHYISHKLLNKTRLWYQSSVQANLSSDNFVQLQLGFPFFV